MSNHEDRATRRKRYQLAGLSPAQIELAMSGMCSAKPSTTTIPRTATGEGKRWAMTLGVVTEGMFGEKLGWPRDTFLGAIGRTVPVPDACQSPRAWTVATANRFLEFLNKPERFSPGSMTLARKVDGVTFAQLIGKTPMEFARLCANDRPDQLPPTVLFTDGTHAWTREAAIGYLLTLAK